MTAFKADDETDVNSGDVTINDSTVTITASDKGVTATDEVAVSGSSTVNVTAGETKGLRVAISI